VRREMLRTSLIEDLNRLACASEQDRFAADPARARDALDRARWIDTTELDRFARDGWLAREEVDLIERFVGFASERLRPPPNEADPISFTRADPSWQLVRERAAELLTALDGFIDIDVAGWGQQHLRVDDVGSDRG